MTQQPKMQARTYSDPDLPQLLPLPVRPSSSYEPRPKVKEDSQFSPEEIEGVAKKMGLDLVKHRDFEWVIRDCLIALRDEGFIVEVHGEDVRYVYKQTGHPRPFHSIVDAHEKMAKRLLAVQAELKVKQLDPHYRVRHHVYMAIMGEKDVRRVCTPALMTEIMKDVDVNPLVETFLIQRIKVTVEDCYFRMKKLGPHLITLDNCIDVESLVVNLELDRVGFCKKISDSGLVYCVECETALGDVISAGCHDVLCNACAVETHSTGNRQDAPMVFIEQAVCVECASMAALVRCQDCVELFCYDCFKMTHSRGKRQRHCVSLPNRTFCFECDEREASYICVECEDALCTRCSSKIHRSGARQNHTLFGIRKAAYNKRLFADNLDRLMGIMQAHVKRTYDLNPWFVFYDQAVAPFWYNFHTKQQVKADPNDLVNPPEEEEDEDEDEAPVDEMQSAATISAAQLKETDVGKFMAKGASFYVPPPLQVKFNSPI